MLEENLKSGTMSPAEVAVNVMSFITVELASQSPSAEARFFQIFKLLCDRVFGPISSKEGYRHESSMGWMARTYRWERPASPSTVSSSSRAVGVGVRRVGVASPLSSPASRSSSSTASISIKSDPVVLLLGAQLALSSSPSQQLTFLQALAMEAAHRPNVRYTLAFKGLPESMQSDWIALIECQFRGLGDLDCNVSTNSKALMGHLFRVGPMHQAGLIQYIQNQQYKKDGGLAAGQRPSLQFSSPFMSTTVSSPSALPFASPVSKSQQEQQTNSSTSSRSKDVATTVQLSMLEYYLLVFLRYPLYPPVDATKAVTPVSSFASRRAPSGGMPSKKQGSYGEAVYEEVLKSYILYYIPVRTPTGSFNGFEVLKRPNELFLRLIIALWLEGQNRILTTEAATVAFRQRRGVTADIGLDKSYDLVQGSSRPLPPIIVRALKRVIDRVVVDGSLDDKAKDISSGLGGSSNDKTTGAALCLNPAMTMLQAPFYCFVRAAFRYESVHSTGSNETKFMDALDMWLVWLEPWNAKWTQMRSNTSTSRIAGKLSPFKQSQSVSGSLMKPSSKHSSAYKPAWEPYIASNLHMYTVPLALFLRRAREFDFSPSKYKSSVETVLRVLRVYTPEVVDVINRLLKSRSTGAPSPFYEFVQKHEENLGPCAPPGDGLWSLSACQEDMQVLLDEILSQHNKKAEECDFGDLIAAYINKFFTDLGASVGGDKELQTLVQKAKVLVGWRPEYAVLTPPQRGSSAMTTMSAGSNLLEVGSGNLVRTEDGDLSEVGRSTLLHGQNKCRVEDTEYYGDKMRALPQSNEVKLLVTLTVKASDFLNGKLGLHPHATVKPTTILGQMLLRVLPKRINLRFLADWRNIWFICFSLWVLMKFF